MKPKHIYRTLLLSSTLLFLANTEFITSTVSADEKTTLADIEIPTTQLEPTTDDNSRFQVPEANHYNVPPTLTQDTPTPSELDISQQIPEVNMPSQQESQPAENNLVTEINIATKLPESDVPSPNSPFRNNQPSNPQKAAAEFEDKAKQYLANLTPEEHQLLEASPDIKSKQKVLESILIRQINEEYSLKELEEFKKTLTPEQKKELEETSDLVEFETKLKSFYQTSQAQQDFGNLVDTLILNSTEEEFRQLQRSADNPEKFTQTILDLAASQAQTNSISETNQTFRMPITAGIPLIIKAAPYIIAGVKALGTAVIAYFGSQAINNSYQYARAQAYQRQQALYATMAKSYVNNQARIQSISQAQSYTYTGPGYYAVQNYTYQPSQSYGYTPNYSYTPQYTGGYTAPARAYGQVAASVFYYTGSLKLPVYNLSGKKHTVLPNESVWSISQKYNIKMNDLIIWNGLTNGLIHPGQKVLVKPDTLINNGLQHQVLPNESVWSISQKYNISMADFRAWNNIKHDTIHPGQKVYIKAKSAAKKAQYIVKAGDSIWKIAKEHGITIDDLVKWNKVTNFTIHPGDTLITTQPPLNPLPPVITKQPLPQLGALYTVKAGDSIWRIAHDHSITMKQLLEWNNITNQTIHPGQQLITQNPASPSAATANKSYTVKAGDSVWRIAQSHGVSMDDLVMWNNISNFTIHPGEVLILKQPTQAPYSGLTTHTVQAGESVWLIAQKYGITMDELVEWNNISNFAIHPGQRVIIGYVPSPETTKLAKELGYRKIKERSKHDKPIYERVKGKGPKFISPDHASHKGGYWKGADTKEKLLSKDARKGTYDKDLKRIDD
ncbi:LysM peptidoglycan-binding domain-containing protein [Streptococcus sp. NLN64]|uniref:LysM peptidoglycan-binding domain-containing protein n=1 Tax=Streptococcus sp. NLN64 TaxID=2822799 RepID=UPI0018CBA8F8|nr:LysM peptidoglycan-binding domain-containing protein [Streptococcus sp. NLN64]MBG9367898.1 LysM peptidoglycan-binding domain-containing protein [Streptococcus sp. NLN64]